MLIQTKDVALIESDALKNAVPIEESVIKDRDLRICVIHELPIEVNFHFAPD